MRLQRKKAGHSPIAASGEPVRELDSELVSFDGRQNQEVTVFFAHGARVIAVLGLILGVLRLLMGLAIVNEWGGLSRDDLGRYSTAATTGQVIDQGLYVILGAVALGTLAEIGLAIRKINRVQ